MAPAMAGTRRAATVCAGCGHTRQVHLHGTPAECAKAMLRPALPGEYPAGQAWRRCPCRRFREPRKER